MVDVAKNLESVRKRIEAACERVGRDPSSVRLVAVTKTVPPEVIEEAIRCGVTDIGENRVQEARDKYEVIGGKVRWHMIGYLQRNKVKYAVKIFDVIHSVDRLELVNELEKRLSREGRRLPVLLEVNVAGEESKHGVAPDNLEELARSVLESPSLEPVGLMTIAPYVEDAEEVRWVFRRLRELRDELNESLQTGAFKELSMGMTNDFEVAIEEGATMVRIGTAIFGERD
ncbi:MAG: YggS family pyridoxal phosphate-dependent enzyme [Deferribacteres bacterium]|nr:YggS family pyridoxal phosphate-dependent enzyme [Deferribacteres bacterium]